MNANRLPVFLVLKMEKENCCEHQRIAFQPTTTSSVAIRGVFLIAAQKQLFVKRTTPHLSLQQGRLYSTNLLHQEGDKSDTTTKQHINQQQTIRHKPPYK